MSSESPVEALRSFLERYPCADSVNNPLILIPTFNNGNYLQNCYQQLEALRLERFLVLDGGSEDQDTLDVLSVLRTRGQVIDLKGNPGPRFFFENKRFFNHLPPVFCVTDPDLEFNPRLPGDFILQLYKLSEELRIGKVGLALSLEGELIRDKFFFGRRWMSIEEWEEQFWRNRVKTSSGLEIYDAAIDTTFALYNKVHLRNNSFFKGIRVAGDYSAKHLPWFSDNPFAEDSVKPSIIAKYSTWNAELSEEKQKRALQYAFKRIDEMERSLSWKITAPLRSINRVLLRVRTRLRRGL